MDNIITSFAVLHKSRESDYVIKDATTDFAVYKSEFLQFTKTVDRPDDYYFFDDEITIILKLKNVGEKNIRGFCLRDDAPKLISPLDSGYYEVISPLGDISFEDNYVVIENIDLAPNEEVEITITGKVKELEESEDKDEDISF